MSGKSSYALCLWLPFSALIAGPVAAIAENADETAKSIKLLETLDQVAKSGDLFRPAAMEAMLGVRLRRTTAPLVENLQRTGQVDTYHPNGTPGNYWLPPTEYQILNHRAAVAVPGQRSYVAQHASLQLSWGSLGQCIDLNTARHVFGRAKAVVAGLPLDGPSSTSMWRWTYIAHDAEPILLEATMFPSGSNCIIAFDLSQAREVASP